MSKQDRQGVRTPADLEQKYNFGKTFAEAFELAEEASQKAEEAKGAVDALDKTLTQDEIFNRLTKNGEVEGIYRDEQGNVYINASYMVSGILRSKDGKTFYLDLDSGVLKGEFEELSISGKDVVTDDVLEEYAQSVTESIEHMQKQIDGQIQSWFYDYVPTTSNYPASEWTTEALKIAHLGDLFYIVDNEESGGLTYRWAIVGDSYQWALVEDCDVAKALAQAAKAQDTADGKRRVFVTQPSPPYDVGDLWTDGADLKVCQAERESGSYYASDWKLATDYIDSGKAEEIAKGKVDAQTQADIFNRLTNNGALKGIYMQDEELYINASYLMSGIINAALVKAGVITSDDGSIKIDLVSNKIEVGEGTGARPAWDSKVEMDAFGIAGYGRHYSTSAFEKTLFIMPGLHYTSSGTILSKIQGLSGIGLSINTDGGTLSLGDLNAPTLIYGSSVEIKGKVDGENEWLTPPTYDGFEYRTMDRFNGEAVYTKLVDFGASGATTSNWQTITLAHGISGISKIIRCEGCINGSKATTLPAINGGLVMVWADKANVYLYRETAYTPPSDERMYVQLWYTK